MLGCMAMSQVHSNRGLHAQKWRNSARKRRNKEFSFRVTAVTPCDGLTVTLQLHLAETSAPDRHDPVTSRPSPPRDEQTVTPCDARHGFERISLPFQKRFFQVSLPLSPPAETHDLNTLLKELGL